MIARKMIYVLASLALVALSFGCKKSKPASTAPATSTTTQVAAVPSLGTYNLVRIHWLGKKRISTDTNAVNVMQVWNLPESARLQAQTLDKLSKAPWRFLRGETNQSSTNLLRPLLDDLIEEESCVEIRKVTNAANVTTEMVLAVHLNDQRAGVWETNLAAVLQSLTGISPTNSSSGSRWSLKKHHAPNLIEFARVGEWVVVGAGQDHNGLLDEMLARIEREHLPMPAAATNFWLNVGIDFPRVASDIGIDPGLGAMLPGISLQVSGEAQDVYTHGELTFPNATSIKLEPWNIPTNFVSADLVSFTAIRGLKPWLESSKLWTDLQIGPPPDQFYVWALRSFPMQTYFAAPLLDASNRVSRLSDRALRLNGPAPLTNVLAGFQRSPMFNGLSWHGFPYFAPFLESIDTNGSSFALGGFFQVDLAEGPTPPELLKEILGQTNLVYYDWELTGPRIEEWTHLSQAIRFVSGVAQLPGDSASIAWLNVMSTRLGNCATEINQTAPGTLSFHRKSSLGFTAIELHLLADWLESPDFPGGLHTFEAPSSPSEMPPP